MDEKNFANEGNLGNQEDFGRMDKGVSLNSKHVVVFLLIIIAFMAVYMGQLKQKCDLEKKEAYVLSVLINAQEDHLRLKYGAEPEDVGLGELRDAWAYNPCKETAQAYSDALQMVIEILSEGGPSELIKPEGVIQV